jgi:hypothetical protein
MKRLLKAYAGFGPVLSVATNGKIEQDNKKRDMFDGKDFDWKKGDFGFNLLAAVELRNRTFDISIGYRPERSR